MGADNLAQLPRWNGWRSIVAGVPFAVMPRPSYTARAVVGRAATVLRHARLPARDAHGLAGRAPPAWVLLPGRPHAASATAIRAQHSSELVPHRP